MASNRFSVRRQNLLRRLKATGVESILVTSPINVTYLTGFTGDSSFLLLAPKVAVLISDSRFTTQIEEECPDLEAVIRSSKSTMSEVVSQESKRLKSRTIAFESGTVTVAQLEGFKSGTGDLNWRPLDGLVEELREIKDASEIAAIREAVGLAERGMLLTRATLLGKMTELEVAHDLEHAMRRFGALHAAFDPIVAVGPRAALPHASPTGAEMRADKFVLFDWGAIGPTGYHSDLTRVWATATISPKLERVYRVVLNAQAAAIAAIRPGVSGSEVDAVARAVIEEAGFGKNFGHGLGHGIGLQIHEGPRLSPLSKSELKPGMVVTVEPGIYLTGWGGVRIEDDVLVTSDGCEVLSSISRDLDMISLA